MYYFSINLYYKIFFDKLKSEFNHGLISTNKFLIGQGHRVIENKIK
jgi:hypothetical protein